MLLEVILDLMITWPCNKWHALAKKKPAYNCLMPYFALLTFNKMAIIVQ